MNELLRIVGLAKVRADAGFSRVGRRLNAADPADRALMTLALEALDRRWPGDFPGAAEMRDAVQISRGQ